MPSWKEFDQALDDEKLNAERATVRRNVMINQVVKCPYRKHAGFYNIKCDHPDRRAGEQCVNLDCPALFDEKFIRNIEEWHHG